jgi:hypothetical protein
MTEPVVASELVDFTEMDDGLVDWELAYSSLGDVAMDTGPKIY